MLPLLLVAFLWGVIFIPLSYLLPWPNMLVSIVAMVCLVWGFTAVSVKRCHDMGYSGFWTLLYLIPGVALVGLAVLGAWPSSGSNRYDQVAGAPAWLRRGKIALAPLAILCALSVYYGPLWAPSFNAASRFDYEGPRVLTRRQRKWRLARKSCGHRELWNKSMAGRNGSRSIVSPAIRGREGPAGSKWRPNGPSQ